MVHTGDEQCISVSKTLWSSVDFIRLALCLENDWSWEQDQWWKWNCCESEAHRQFLSGDRTVVRLGSVYTSSDLSLPLGCGGEVLPVYSPKIFPDR